ncbi:putative acyltransferase [Gelidibacter sediminis]|uniref:Putative acyltransferase n=1 Tax=Gelidibacter sediminis TaxID=1608710 RepID=A0A4R7PZ82_9FLAO|nr:heparan-alpha-glucosaminide N-acetyltransferase domain-containing protein [Gelidibacter sediminis]TDU40333.1 putative acyltransferase [Gelidibacter sediminis]
MSTSQRIISLDVLRGMTISLMILVNTPGSWSFIYSPLRHAVWHGSTPTDLVFPFFLFIVGVSLYFSFKKYEKAASKAAISKILKRTFGIFLIGLLLNLYPYFNFENVRIMGVLQRIALAYGAGALLCVNFTKRKLWMILAIILFGYWALLYYGGGLDPYALEDNVVRTLDLYVFGDQHIYKGFGIPFDPEGLLSSIPAVGTVIIGYLIGDMIHNTKSLILKMKTLSVYGALMTILGGAWGLVLPINKPLWTSSYVLYTAGLATLVLVVLIFIIDYKKTSSWSRPFVHFGSNPLFIFVFSGVYAKTISYIIKLPVSGQTDTISLYRYLFSNVFAPTFGNMNGSLLFAISHIIVFWAICYLLYRNKIFIKI